VPMCAVAITEGLCQRDLGSTHEKLTREGKFPWGLHVAVKDARDWTGGSMETIDHMQNS